MGSNAMMMKYKAVPQNVMIGIVCVELAGIQCRCEVVSTSVIMGLGVVGWTRSYSNVPRCL